MKKLLLAFLFLLPIICYSQNNPNDIEIAQEYCQTYFKNQNIVLLAPIHVKLMKELAIPLENKEKLIGLYNTDDRTIYINSLSDLQKQKIILFDQPINKEIYISYLIHEISHAYISDQVLSSNLNISQPMHELLAYSVQFSYFSKDFINALYKNNPIVDIKDLETILNFHDYHPQKFAMYSYQYYLKQPSDYLDTFLH